MDAASTLKLHQLKDLLFEHEFLIVLIEEEGLACDVFTLLDELVLHKLPAPTVKYLIEFEAFFTQLVKDLALRRNADFQIKTQINEIRLKWDFIEAIRRNSMTSRPRNSSASTNNKPSINKFRTTKLK